MESKTKTFLWNSPFQFNFEFSKKAEEALLDNIIESLTGKNEALQNELFTETHGISKPVCGKVFKKGIYWPGLLR